MYLKIVLNSLFFAANLACIVCLIVFEVATRDWIREKTNEGVGENYQDDLFSLPFACAVWPKLGTSESSTLYVYSTRDRFRFPTQHFECRLYSAYMNRDIFQSRVCDDLKASILRKVDNSRLAYDKRHFTGSKNTTDMYYRFECYRTFNFGTRLYAISVYGRVCVCVIAILLLSACYLVETFYFSERRRVINNLNKILGTLNTSLDVCRLCVIMIWTVVIHMVMHRWYASEYEMYIYYVNSIILFLQMSLTLFSSRENWRTASYTYLRMLNSVKLYASIVCIILSVCVYVIYILYMLFFRYKSPPEQSDKIQFRAYEINACIVLWIISFVFEIFVYVIRIIVYMG